MIIMEKEKLTYRNLVFDDLETVCKLPRNKQELFLCFLKLISFSNRSIREYDKR